MIVYDLALNRVFKDGKKLNCMCEARPQYGPTPVVETDESGIIHYECRILLRLCLLAIMPKRRDGQVVRVDGQLQYYDVDKIAVSSHIFEKYKEGQAPIEIVMYEQCLEVVRFNMDDLMFMMRTFGMAAYKEIMLRAENILQVTLQKLYSEKGYGRVCPGLDFKYFDDKVPEIYKHSPDEGYLQLFKRRNAVALAIEDVKADLEELTPDVNLTEEVKVQKARLAELKREFRSLHRTLKKMTPSEEIATLLDEEIQHYNSLTKETEQMFWDKAQHYANNKSTKQE